MACRAITVIALAAGCSGSSATPKQSGHVHFVADCADTASLAFVDAAPGQTAVEVIDVVNDGDVDIMNPGFALKLTGPNASEFTVYQEHFRDPPAYLCDTDKVLPAGGWCQLTLTFQPTTVGAKQGTLKVEGAGALPLSASAIDTPTTFHADWVDPAFGFLPPLGLSLGPFPSPTIDLQLVNDSAASVSTALTLDAPYTLKNSCPDPLTPGGACMIEIDLPIGSASYTSCMTSHLTGSGLDIPVTYTPTLPMSTDLGVAPYGDGFGTVVSSNGDINCTVLPNHGEAGAPGCSRRYWQVPAPLELTASAAAGSWFVAWAIEGPLVSCGNSPSCTVTVPPQSQLMEVGTGLTPWFALNTDKVIHINVVGNGTVYNWGDCYANSACAFPVPPGQTITLLAATSGTFVGWSGDCTGTNECQLGIIENDRTVTATFSP